MRILHVGATGLVGQQVLARLLADPRVAQVVAPTRRVLAVSDPRLLNPAVDFAALPETAPWWAVDGVICTLGTTIAQAGSQAAFRTVDLEYPLAVARIALAHSARVFALNSAMGADPRSRIFYNRTKGELEAALAALGYPSLALVRPGLIGGEREDVRRGERAATIVLQALGPVLPRRWRINPAACIAAALVEAVLLPVQGQVAVGSDQLVDAGPFKWVPVRG
ncbi:Rossmann-fold NAD(P)-binding domain-containing protein [Luteimonas sp. RIT-PG2_3]